MDSLRAAVESLPASLRQSVVGYCQDLSPELNALLAEPALAEQAAGVWAVSEFAARLCLRHPERLIDLAGGDLRRRYDPADYGERLAVLAQAGDDADFECRLRVCRQRELLRIAWRDLTGLAADLDETLNELSAFADAAIDAALSRHYRQFCDRFGTPRDANGAAQRLTVLALGKLGGRELNFSSDVDLLLVYPGPGQTDGKRTLESQDFFRRVGQRLVKSLSEVTVDGFVFRVDLRLRPFGDAGPLVISADACEDYYQSHGREWERYALIKARPVAGDLAAGHRLLDALRPFIYRRYLDYGALASLRSLKTMIADQVKRKGMADNLKLGAGGIREVEFIGQAFQLIYGGRDTALRGQSLRPVLRCLASSQRLSATTVAELDAAYVLLRRAENRLQMAADQQTHELPRDGPARERLAYALGHPDWPACAAELSAHRARVNRLFAELIATDQPAPPRFDWPAVDGETDTVAQQGELSEYLNKLGFTDPAAAVRRLAGLHRGLRTLSATGRERLRRLLPLLLEEIAEKHPDQAPEVLDRLLPLLEAVASRAVYLALLLDRPVVRSQLIALCAASPWISQYLSRYPLLLDDLIDPRALYRPLSRAELAQGLTQTLAAADPGDQEQQLDALRHFKQRSELRVAAADISGALPLMIVSDHLTDIAEVVLNEVLVLAWQQLEPRFGRPQAETDDGGLYQPALAIIGYGKLGGIELGYGSDLDLVFLHDSAGRKQHTDGPRELDNSTFFIRLAQRIIHLLSVATVAGTAYEVDTRLRPSGRSGLLVSGIEAFADYQRQQAWTWEHQALVRARFIAGPERLRQRFDALRREVLCRPRETDALRREVVEMRGKMQAELGSLAKNAGGQWHLKHDRGGIGDIEFIVQYLVLAHAHSHPELTRYSDNIRQLEACQQAGVLSADRAGELNRSYQALRRRVHRLRLQQQPELIAADDPLRRECLPVAELWQALMLAGEADAEPG